MWVRDIIPLISVVVVDDISDSGKQLKKFKDAGFFIATLFRKPGTIAEPDIWVQTKYEKWIRFPWEKEELK